MNNNEIQRFTYQVQASQRNTGSVSDFYIKLPRLIEKVAKNSRLTMQINDCTVPFSFFQLSNDINTVQVKFTNTSGISKTIPITLTAGNYNAINILTELSSKLTIGAQTSYLSYTGFTPIFNFSYSTVDGRHTLALTSPANTSILIYFSLNTNLGRFFGFSSDATISPTSSPVSDKMVCTNPVCQIYLRCGNLRQQNNREYIVENAVFSDIVYILPVASQQLTYISTNHAGDEIILTDDNITDINFYITSNLNYNALDLQGLDNFSFSFTIREREAPTYDRRETDLLQNKIAPIIQQPTPTQEYTPTEEEMKLMKERDKILTKLNKYKEKLSRKIKNEPQPANAYDDVLQPGKPAGLFSEQQTT